MVAETEPGPTMPMPTAPAPWSPAPATTGIPAASPVAAAPAWLMWAQISGPSKSRGSHSIGMPAASASTLDQRRWVTSSSRVPLASCRWRTRGHLVADVVLGTEDVGDSSRFPAGACAPRAVGQGEVGQRRIAGEFDETRAADLRLQPVALGLGALIAVSAGRRTLPSASSITQPCIWPVRPMASTGAPLRAGSASTAAMASRAARHQSSGSCSAQPMCSEWMGGVFAGRRGRYLTAIHQHRARAAGAYVNS